MLGRGWGGERKVCRRFGNTVADIFFFAQSGFGRGGVSRIEMRHGGLGHALETDLDAGRALCFLHARLRRLMGSRNASLGLLRRGGVCLYCYYLQYDEDVI